jgi:hypothetical protein
MPAIHAAYHHHDQVCVQRVVLIVLIWVDSGQRQGQGSNTTPNTFTLLPPQTCVAALRRCGPPSAPSSFSLRHTFHIQTQATPAPPQASNGACVDIRTLVECGWAGAAERGALAMGRGARVMPRFFCRHAVSHTTHPPSHHSTDGSGGCTSTLRARLHSHAEAGRRR